MLPVMLSILTSKRLRVRKRSLCSHRTENFYASFRTNTRLAKLNVHIATVTFDFQQNLPLPHTPIGEVFYMQQLWLYVFGVHECGSNNAVMYCWPEFIPGKGSNEVVLCLDNFFHCLPKHVTTLCIYKNKNFTVMQYLIETLFVLRISRGEIGCIHLRNGTT